MTRAGDRTKHIHEENESRKKGIVKKRNRENRNREERELSPKKS